MLQNTFHFVCRHYEGSYSEISVIRFVVPVCFASGLLHTSLLKTLTEMRQRKVHVCKSGRASTCVSYAVPFPRHLCVARGLVCVLQALGPISHGVYWSLASRPFACCQPSNFRVWCVPCLVATSHTSRVHLLFPVSCLPAPTRRLHAFGVRDPQWHYPCVARASSTLPEWLLVHAGCGVTATIVDL